MLDRQVACEALPRRKLANANSLFNRVAGRNSLRSDPDRDLDPCALAAGAGGSGTLGPMAQAKRSIARGTLLVAALAAASCLSCPPPFQNVNVRSEPTGADIFLDGALVKQTPARLELSTLKD